jgi:formyltetrahydrofolate deformylase
VTENLDEGPIITQSVLHVNHGDDPEEMARRGQDVEKIVLARATELVLEDRVLIDGHRTIIFD